MKFLNKYSLWLSFFSLFCRCQLKKPAMLLYKETIQVNIGYGNMLRLDRMTKGEIQLLSCKSYVGEHVNFYILSVNIDKYGLEFV